MPHHKQWAYLLLRVTIGSTFLFHGISKFQVGVDAVAASLDKQFANSWLPGVPGWPRSGRLVQLPPAAGGHERRCSETLPEKVVPATRFPAEYRNISRRVLCLSNTFELIFLRLSNVDYVP